MNYLVDTNILTRLADPGHAMHQEALDAVKLIGKNGHDARLVAAMTVHGLTHLLSFNAQDFRQYRAITVVTPADVLTP